MAVNNLVHVNESGLPLNAIEWLETHHRSKMPEREQMIRDLRLKKGSYVVDAGCGPGLWTPLLARAIGRQGRITGVDISPAALITAQQRSQEQWYQHRVQYKQGVLEQLPVRRGSADVIFSANVSQYLPDPIGTFAAMGQYLKQDGQLIIKDIDFGTMRFYNIDPTLQARVLQAREQWEQQRVDAGYAYEDSWVGSKLAAYMRAAGYTEIEEKSYRITRRYPVPEAFRFYLQGIAEWFVCEGAPLLEQAYHKQWLQLFLDGEQCALDKETFVSEETEYIVTGIWRNPPPTPAKFYDMHIIEAEEVLV
ncbi:MAG: methyltransferase domain-containing protein [Ktedonobacteraceae bacterium]